MQSHLTGSAQQDKQSLLALEVRQLVKDDCNSWLAVVSPSEEPCFIFQRAVQVMIIKAKKKRMLRFQSVSCVFMLLLNKECPGLLGTEVAEVYYR